MKKQFAASHLDVRGFAQASGELDGCDLLSRYHRIAADCLENGGDAKVTWAARGEVRAGPLGQPEYWLHLHAETSAPVTCQRCLQGVAVPLLVDRHFRFVADEATAAAQDDAAAEDLLVLTADFDLHLLIEDELVMELPLIPRHALCPRQPLLAVSDPGFDAPADDRPNPFAVLAHLKPPAGCEKE